MPSLDFTFARHIVLDETKFYYWNNENTNPTRNGLSWATAWRDGEGTVGAGNMSFIKATDTPYRSVWNVPAMSNDMMYFDCTGNGFDRGIKKADLRASSILQFTLAASNIYTAPHADRLVSPRTNAGNMTDPGTYLFSESLNYHGAWGVWYVEGANETEIVTPLTRVLNYNELAHGNWYWFDDVIYIRWDSPFDASQFEVIRDAKSIEIWTDTVPADHWRTGACGMRSRFGLYGHHNGACQGWRVSDSEFAWNAKDGFALIAENVYAKTYNLQTQIYRCHIHHNYRDGITNYSSPDGAAGAGYNAWYDLSADFNYIHDNGGAGVFIHRTTRTFVDSDFPDVNHPFNINNNTIINNGRGVVITDERMLDVIDTFGLDTGYVSEFISYTTQQKIDLWNSFLPEYDTAYVRLRNNNICNNGKNLDLITDTWENTTFIIDSDYNNIFPSEEAWVEGDHSISVDPLFTDTPIISALSPLSGASTCGFVYLQNSEAYAYYYTPDALPYKWTQTSEAFNIGAGPSGMARVDFYFGRLMPTVSINTKMFQVLSGEDYIIVVGRSSLVSTNTICIYPDEAIVVGRSSYISTTVPYADADVIAAIAMVIRINGVWRRVIGSSVLVEAAWKTVTNIYALNNSWGSLLQP